jgi:hypothetical protein
MPRNTPFLVVVLTTDLLAGCYSMNFSEYKGDAVSAGANGIPEVGEVATSEFDAGPADGDFVSRDLVQAPDSLAPGNVDLPSAEPDLIAPAADLSPGSTDLASPPDLMGQTGDLAQDLPSGAPDLTPHDAEPEADAAADADGAAGILCGSGTEPIFTDGFDRPSLVAAGWSANFVGGGMFSLDNSTYVSQPTSALLYLPETQMGSTCSASLSMMFPSPHAPTAHLAFDVKVSGSCLQSGSPGLFIVSPRSIATLSPASGYHLDIYIAPGPVTTVYVKEYDGAGNSYAPAAQQSISVDEWLHIDLQLRFSGEPRGALSVGGRPAQLFVPTPTGAASYGDQQVFLGIGAANMVPPSPACNVNYDNVAFSMPAPCTN